MASAFARIFDNMNGGRYPEPQEEQELVQYVNSLPKRLECARSVQTQEEKILTKTITELAPRYPQFEHTRSEAWEKTMRDLQYVLRYNVQGMLSDDIEYAGENLLYWLRTILTSNGMTGGFLEDVASHLRKAVEEHISGEAFVLIEPHLTKTVEILRGAEEPVLV